MSLSRTQVDRLGERLRRGTPSDDDLRLLDAYRRSFVEPYATVLAVLRDEMGLLPTGRPAKSTKSIIDKLNRETARLSQVQDIAGCRVVTPDVAAQDRTVDAIRERLSVTTVVDRRTRPSHGYRAVHVLVAAGEQRVEVQVRTALQQLWAELSEKLSDRLGISVKYGGGDPSARSLLDGTSGLVADVEMAEVGLAALELNWGTLPPESIAARRVQVLRAARQLNFDQARAVLQAAIARLAAPDT